MKKGIIILLIFTHLFSTVGFSMNVHYCGTHKSYSFFGVPLNETCACNHQDYQHSQDCCKDKKVEVKAQKKENIHSKTYTLKQFPVLAFFSIFNFVPKKSFPQTNNITICTGHPPNHSPPLYILNSVFRI